MSDTGRSMLQGWNSGWITDPPVSRVPKGDRVKGLVQQLRNSIVGYMPADARSAAFDAIAWESWVASTKPDWKQGGQALADDPKLKAFRKDPGSFQDAWNERQEDGLWILDRIDEGDDINLVYMLFGQPVGILCMDPGDPASVSWVATHPGVADAGATLIEAAVEAAGGSGRLTLTSLSTASTFYQRLGFVEDGSKMTLTPGAPLWAHVGGKWRLSQYNGTKYFKAVKPLPPVPVKK